MKPARAVLVANGPVVPVTITIPDIGERSLVELRSPVPEPVTGFALIDTGADCSCFDQSSALQAGLPIIGERTITSASHTKNELPLYAGKMLLPRLDDLEVEGVGVNLSGIDGMVAIIGRDLLKNAIFVYNGLDGTYTLAV